MTSASDGRRRPSVGVSYCSAMRELVEQPGAVDLVEVEPETFWLHAPGTTAPFRVDDAALQAIVDLPLPKVIHGVGFPVGGTIRPDVRHLPAMREVIAALAPPWVSEHLSFNEAQAGADSFTTAFMLPPRQTAAGVEAARRSIRSMSEALAIPFAVETGVNYWAPRSDELPDGAFVADVADAADCGLVLDLHNLWTNERNGRQTMSEFVSQLALERVWEIHLAGGEERRGFWLDGHNDGVPPEVLEMYERVLPHCPNLRAVVFEVFSAWVPVLGLDRIAAEITKVRACNGSRPSREPLPRAAPRPMPADDAIDPSEWETALGRIVIGREPATPLERELAGDMALSVVRELLGEFRGSMLVDAMPLTVRLLLLTLGNEAVTDLFEAFWAERAPAKFGATEARGFADYLRERPLAIAYLDEVADYERAVLHALVYGEAQTAHFRHDPLPLLRALARAELPVDLTMGDYCIDITP